MCYLRTTMKTKRRLALMRHNSHHVIKPGTQFVRREVCCIRASSSADNHASFAASLQAPLWRHQHYYHHHHHQQQQQQQQHSKQQQQWRRLSLINIMLSRLHPPHKVNTPSPSVRPSASPSVCLSVGTSVCLCRISSNEQQKDTESSNLALVLPVRNVIIGCDVLRSVGQKWPYSLQSSNAV